MRLRRLWWSPRRFLLQRSPASLSPNLHWTEPPTTIGSPFTTTWVLQNTGTGEWDQTIYDVRFAGALNNVWLHTGRRHLRSDLLGGSRSDLQFLRPHARPDLYGQYGEAWEIVGSDGSVACYFYLYINVP